eukprot:ANDGO_06290.mRNA.1 variant
METTCGNYQSEYYFGLDPLFQAGVKLLIRDVHALAPHPGSASGYFSLCRRPILSCHLLGFVVSTPGHWQDARFSFSIDDGSAVIGCTMWSSNKGSSDARVSPVALGELVHVFGRISVYGSSKQVSVEQIVKSDDLNDVSLFVLECVHLFRTVYSRPPPDIAPSLCRPGFVRPAKCDATALATASLASASSSSSAAPAPAAPALTPAPPLTMVAAGAATDPHSAYLSQYLDAHRDVEFLLLNELPADLCVGFNKHAVELGVKQSQTHSVLQKAVETLYGRGDLRMHDPNTYEVLRIPLLGNFVRVYMQQRAGEQAFSSISILPGLRTMFPFLAHLPIPKIQQALAYLEAEGAIYEADHHKYKLV